MRALLALFLSLLPSCAFGQSVQFDRPGLGLSAYALPRAMSAVELGLPDGQWEHHRRSLTYDGLYRLGWGGGLELQVGTGNGNFLGIKYAQSVSAQCASGTLLTIGQGASLGQVISWAHGPWGIAAFVQLGRGYEAVGNASYAFGALSPYVEAGFLHDGFLGHSRVLGAGLAWALTPAVQWDIQGRYLPTLHAWQAGWGLSFAF